MCSLGPKSQTLNRDLRLPIEFDFRFMIYVGYLGRGCESRGQGEDWACKC